MPETSEPASDPYYDEVYDYDDIVAHVALDNGDAMRISRAGDESWNDMRLTYHTAPLMGDDKYSTSIDVSVSGGFENLMVYALDTERYVQYLDTVHYRQFLHRFNNGQWNPQSFLAWLGQRINEQNV